MARLAQTYDFLGQKMVVPVHFEPVKPYGVEFTANGQPQMQVGNWFRLDLFFTIMVGDDTDFAVRLIDAVGSQQTFKCPQMRGQEGAPGNVSVGGSGASAGDARVPVSGSRAITPNRAIKFANHSGVYLVKHGATRTRIDVVPALTADVPSGTKVVHDDSDAALTYRGVFAGDIDLRTVYYRSRDGRRLRPYGVRLHEMR